MPALVKSSFTEALLHVLKCTDAVNPFDILNFIFFVGVKKKTFVFFLTAICGLVKDCFICKTLHFAFCLDFLICTIILNLLMCACLACLFLFALSKQDLKRIVLFLLSLACGSFQFVFIAFNPLKRFSCGFLLVVCEESFLIFVVCCM